jgi:hypothetical protein
MAKLEFYRQQVVPRIATPSGRGLAAVGTQAAETAEAIARGATALGRLTADLDELRVEDAYNKLREKQTDLMMNPETGFSSKKAADAAAPDFMSKYSGDFDKAIDEVAGGLPSNRQKDLFRRRAQMAKTEYNDSLMRHVLRETEQYRDNVYKGAIATETNAAALNWNDPIKINDSIGRIAANTSMWADRNGITGDALMAAQIDNLAAIHSAVVNAALDNGDVEYAAQYVDQNRNTIRADKLIDLEGKITEETDLRASARIADDVIKSFKGKMPNETEIRQRVRDAAGNNVKVRDEATREALSQLGSLQRDKEQREDRILDTVYRQLEANGGNYAGLSASLRAAIPGDKIGTVRNFADSLRAGKKIETDWDTYYSLRTNPNLLSRTNLMALKPNLDDTEFKELSALQASIQDRPEVAQTEVQTTTQRMNMRLAEMGVDPTPKKGTAAAKRVAKAWSTLDANIVQREQALGRKLTPEERNGEIDRLFASAEVRGRLFGTNEVALFELEPGKEVVTIEVPDFDRRKIEQALRANKKPVTEENIQYYFKKAQGLIK